MSNRLVSVVMTTYNEIECINKTIESILNQTYENIEIVIVDDGSVDGTRNVLKNYINRDNFKIFFNEHSGNIGKNLNFCIRNSSGSIIAIMGADDKWMPDKLSIQVKELETEQVVCSNGNVIDRNDLVINEYVGNFSNDFYIDLPMLLYDNFILSSSVTAHKTVLIECGLFDEKVGNKSEDYYLWLNIVSKYRIKYVKKVLVSYRVNGDNLTLRSYEDKVTLMLRNLELISPYLSSIDLKIATAAKSGILLTYSRLAKYSYSNNKYVEAEIYCRKWILNCDNKISFKFTKVICFLFYLKVLKILT